MNTTIQQLVKHVSVREFKNERLSDETKQHLLTAARCDSYLLQVLLSIEIQLYQHYKHLKNSLIWIK